MAIAADTTPPQAMISARVPSFLCGILSNPNEVRPSGTVAAGAPRNGRSRRRAATTTRRPFSHDTRAAAPGRWLSRASRAAAQRVGWYDAVHALHPLRRPLAGCGSWRPLPRALPGRAAAAVIFAAVSGRGQVVLGPFHDMTLHDIQLHYITLHYIPFPTPPPRPRAQAVLGPFHSIP